MPPATLQPAAAVRPPFPWERGAGAQSTGPARPVASAVVSLLAGAATAFTVSLVGEMPVGEVVLFAVCGWLILELALTKARPGPLLTGGWFRAAMIAQAVALGAYVFSDLVRGSSPHDMARGWGRMVFLAVDVTAVAWLFGRSARNFLWLLFGVLGGEALKALLFGALFGDLWKFGIGLPVTFATLGLASLAGPVVASGAAAGLCLLNFAMDFRSLGSLCMLVSALVAVRAAPPRLRLWAVPAGVALALLAAGAVYQHSKSDREGRRTSRSDIDRTSMLLAAGEAVVASPLLGQGSWFGKSEVMDNYLLIRDDLAKEANIGGFAGPNEEVEGVALHSQLLVALAEGGVFGAAFFVVYGAGLVWAGARTVFSTGRDRVAPVRLLALTLAFFHLFMSPFSGAHRVLIAMAAGLVFLIAWESRAERGDRVDDGSEEALS